MTGGGMYDNTEAGDDCSGGMYDDTRAGDDCSVGMYDDTRVAKLIQAWSAGVPLQ